MKARPLIAMLFLSILPFTAVAQKARPEANDAEVAPPSLQKALIIPKPDSELLTTLLAVKPHIPLGPDYVLEAYENDMTLIGQKMSAELASVENALRAGRLTRAEAEYLIQQRYQIAMMQYEVFSTLHEALEQDIAQAAVGAKTISSPPGSETAVVVNAPGAASPSQGP